MLAAGTLSALVNIERRASTEPNTRVITVITPTAFHNAPIGAPDSIKRAPAIASIAVDKPSKAPPILRVFKELAA